MTSQRRGGRATTLPFSHSLRSFTGQFMVCIKVLLNTWEVSLHSSNSIQSRDCTHYAFRCWADELFIKRTPISRSLFLMISSKEDSHDLSDSKRKVVRLFSMAKSLIRLIFSHHSRLYTIVSMTDFVLILLLFSLFPVYFDSQAGSSWMSPAKFVVITPPANTMVSLPVMGKSSSLRGFLVLDSSLLPKRSRSYPSELFSLNKL